MIAALGTGVLLLAALAVWLAVARRAWFAVGGVGVLVLAAVAGQAFLKRAWFGALIQSAEREVNLAVAEWNSRAPANVQFIVSGIDDLAVAGGTSEPHSAIAAFSSSVLTFFDAPAFAFRHQELQVVMLEVERRREEERVLITPEGDGMMLSVKVVPR
ncbi:hypothetical protein BDK51DRAFT_26184 [Blyttiomyces helicus]|uniref:Uncharacterized protein n=1 Tax=Blyttiomyces helicus TaxID=388810 RepID=A0A4P9WAE3_9FUNG|nr:hypothetical protein BDK51DRAFT_26184 [Blyttiomyces helicus]|eukprot:RKO89559.1 hypothetical protein BDK51DRAFT_26184 [Blyttiomyces helicus]